MTPVNLLRAVIRDKSKQRSYFRRYNRGGYGSHNGRNLMNLFYKNRLFILAVITALFILSGCGVPSKED